MKETIVLQLTNDPHENAMMLPQIGPDRMLDGAFDEAPTCNLIGLGKSDFVVRITFYKCGTCLVHVSYYICVAVRYLFACYFPSNEETLIMLELNVQA